MSKKILCNRNTYLLFLVLSVGSLVLALDKGRSSLPRKDSHTPEVMASDWMWPKRLGSPVNTSRPEDAIEISPDGKRLFFMYAKDLLENMSPKEMLSRPNGTYVATRIGGPTDFSKPVFYDLGKGTSLSLDGELSFSPDGTTVYFHSNRAENTGRQQHPPKDDPVDIYVADIVNGVPTPARNLGPPVNSAYPDGEHAIHPDGVTLYFTSSRPGGLGKNDIWMSKQDGKSWSKPVNLGTPINSGRNELQPAFTSDGETMYFSSDRNPGIGMAIYRSKRIGNSWTKPGLVMKGIVGEPSITADGKYLYFVHILTDANGVFDADVWVSERKPSE